MAPAFEGLNMLPATYQLHLVGGMELPAWTVCTSVSQQHCGYAERGSASGDPYRYEMQVVTPCSLGCTCCPAGTCPAAESPYSFIFFFFFFGNLVGFIT
jgi:hypothetical protein